MRAPATETVLGVALVAFATALFVIMAWASSAPGGAIAWASAGIITALLMVTFLPRLLTGTWPGADSDGASGERSASPVVHDNCWWREQAERKDAQRAHLRADLEAYFDATLPTRLDDTEIWEIFARPENGGAQ